MRKHYDLDSLADTGTLPKSRGYQVDAEEKQLAELGRPHRPDARLVPTVLVEPNVLLREGLKRILADTSYSLVASAVSVEDARRVWREDGAPFLLIADATNNHAVICEKVQQLKVEHPSARVVMLVDDHDLKRVLEAFQAGADAYLIKTVSCEVLIKTLDLVMLGEAVFPSAVLSLVRDQAYETNGANGGLDDADAGDGEDKTPPKGLSVRETVILRCLMEGDSNKLIARKFDITEATVKVHVKAILRKIRAKNRTQAAIWAASHLPANGRVPTN
ncbi:LuxR C-terminal-related transcriptional regulator [Microvirga alba]|uniref:Response regulator transcription factor n=1 Tax=Microvirga alba TaxID=2791025 RepID=A0A931FT70_9HYPH|nr:response regulator transcription factor [Microvirga alba]MBF9234411.1 response regulator transcription factor [Microvirga alba]